METDAALSIAEGSERCGGCGAAAAAASRDAAPGFLLGRTERLLAAAALWARLGLLSCECFEFHMLISREALFHFCCFPLPPAWF